MYFPIVLEGAVNPIAATGLARGAWLMIAIPALVSAVLLLAGITPEVLVVLVPFNVLMSAFVHANLNWTLGPFKYVISGPVFHRWHHTSLERGGSSSC